MELEKYYQKITGECCLTFGIPLYEVKLVHSIPRKYGNWLRGVIVYDTKKITIAQYSPNGKKSLEKSMLQTLLHELAHAESINRLGVNKGSGHKKEFRDSMLKIVKWAIEKGYADKDVIEHVTYRLTKKHLNKHLNKNDIFDVLKTLKDIKSDVNKMKKAIATK